MADVFLIHSLSDLFTRARNWIARLCRFSHPNLWMIMLFRTRCVGAESIYESLYNYAHISRECRFNIIKTDDRGNTIEHGLILCLQLSEGWGWGRIGRGAHPGAKKHQRWLTNEVGQQEQQCYWNEDGTESSTFPVAVLIGFLQAEGRSREGVSRQGAWGRWVHRAGGQRVSWWCCAIHWWCSTRFEQEVPGKKRHFLVSRNRNNFSGVSIMIKL